MKTLLFLGTSLAIGGGLALAVDKAPASSAPVQMVVTVEARRGVNVPALNREDFLVYQDKERLQVVDAVPLQGRNGELELFILLDDSSSWALGSELADLRTFIDTQTASTAIAIGYMSHGAVETVQNPTKDHALAAKALRLPFGMASSPYLSLSELIKRWPESQARREVLMVTSGADPLGGNGVMNPYLDAAIKDAQRAGITVHAIYTPSTGHSAHSYWRMNWGQNYLAELTDETGGEAYMLGSGTPVSIAPYLADITTRLTHQYRISFLANAEGKPGVKSIKVTTEVPNAEIVAASKVYIPHSLP
jgi:hypothetical protein